MHRIDDRDLQTLIAVAIKTAPKTTKQLLRSKLNTDRDEGARRLADLITRQISNDSTMVISTELVSNIGNMGRAGRWGVDEPDPTRVTLIEQHSLCDVHELTRKSGLEV